LGTFIAGLVIPLVLHLGYGEPGRIRVTVAAISALAGGFTLRFGVVTVSPALLHVVGEQPPDEMLRRLSDISDSPLYSTWAGIALISATVVLGCAIPALLRRQWQLSVGPTVLACCVSVLAIACVLHYSFHPLADRTEFALIHSPEDGRERGGGVGASAYNRPDPVRMRTKFNQSP
jgi:hypothetical protein